jgi:glycosyltransferase involved in cell wall biosynthesis
VNLDAYKPGEGEATRRRLVIPREAFVVGHVGRLAIEKNLGFLSRAVARFLLQFPAAHFLVAGDGPASKEVQEILAALGVADRLHMAGVVEPQALPSFYDAMDVFAFASHSETEGLVLVEAMAAGVPVVAVDAPGVREVVYDQINGRLIALENLDEFVAALMWVASLDQEEKRRSHEGARKTAREFSLSLSARMILATYYSLLERKLPDKTVEIGRLSLARSRIATEWEILRNLAHAAGDAVLHL